jgi:hypothetical protein
MKTVPLMKSPTSEGIYLSNVPDMYVVHYGSKMARLMNGDSQLRWRASWKAFLGGGDCRATGRTLTELGERAGCKFTVVQKLPRE